MSYHNSKLLSFLMVLVAFAAVGCASSALFKPDRPALTANEQITCAEACEMIHACCSRGCSDTRVMTRWTPDNSACVGASNSELEECYRTCK